MCSRQIANEVGAINAINGNRKSINTKHMDDIKQNIKLESLRACAQKAKIKRNLKVCVVDENTIYNPIYSVYKTLHIKNTGGAKHV